MYVKTLNGKGFLRLLNADHIIAAWIEEKAEDFVVKVLVLSNREFNIFRGPELNAKHLLDKLLGRLMTQMGRDGKMRMIFDVYGTH